MDIHLYFKVIKHRITKSVEFKLPL